MKVETINNDSKCYSSLQTKFNNTNLNNNANNDTNNSFIKENIIINDNECNSVNESLFENNIDIKLEDGNYDNNSSPKDNNNGTEFIYENNKNYNKFYDNKNYAYEKIMSEVLSDSSSDLNEYINKDTFYNKESYTLMKNSNLKNLKNCSNLKNDIKRLNNMEKKNTKINDSDDIHDNLNKENILSIDNTENSINIVYSPSKYKSNYIKDESNNTILYQAPKNNSSYIDNTNNLYNCTSLNGQQINSKIINNSSISTPKIKPSNNSKIYDSVQGSPLIFENIKNDERSKGEVDIKYKYNDSKDNDIKTNNDSSILESTNELSLSEDFLNKLEAINKIDFDDYKKEYEKINNLNSIINNDINININNDNDNEINNNNNENYKFDENMNTDININNINNTINNSITSFSLKMTDKEKINNNSINKLSNNESKDHNITDSALESTIQLNKNVENETINNLSTLPNNKNNEINDNNVDNNYKSNNNNGKIHIRIHSNVSPKITVSKINHMTDETISLVLNEESQDNNYSELENEKIENPNLPSNSPKTINGITISEITNTEFLNDTLNINSLKNNTQSIKENNVLHQFNYDKNSEQMVSDESKFKKKNIINKNLNYLKSLFSSDNLLNKKNDINDNTNITKDEDDKMTIEKNSSKLLQKKRHQKLLNKEDQQNILNAFTKVNEFKNKIITKKYILNPEEENIMNVLKPDENHLLTPNIINENISHTRNSPIHIKNEKKVKKSNNNENLNKSGDNNTKVQYNSNIPLKINILNLKKPELSKQEELFLDSLEIITDILRSSLHNIEPNKQWKILENKEFTIDYRLIVIKKIIEIRESRIDEIKTIKNCFDIDCNLNRCKEIIKRILKNKKMEKYSVGELGMTLLNIIRFYPQNFIPVSLFKTYFSTTFGNYNNLSIFNNFNDKEREIWDKLISHFSKILKQENALSWSLYLSNILGWILTPRSLIQPGDPISRNEIGKYLNEINQNKCTENISYELKEILFCRNIKMVFNIFNLCSNTEQIKINSKALLYAYIAESDPIPLIEEAITYEINDCDDINKLFSTETTASNLLIEYLRLEGKSYLENFIKTTIKYLLKKMHYMKLICIKNHQKLSLRKDIKTFLS
ncbi:hypothetical protein LY90DRAFT_146508 [Neocallimastix californiae]|uniref:Ras-GAP domain-containing protein n=1 Tax=Neocallimastix californiae TaxID=1754190 RepID=A0A1Y2AEK6_9FUNG|nr:hypothetical protein LY90DRAFT_146508 [Neocallimastix californiae]|eukprot:ORY20991.1 hypothetical protein LY90DRAFT_146508 [Neocallimastix californiae]